MSNSKPILIERNAPHICLFCGARFWDKKERAIHEQWCAPQGYSPTPRQMPKAGK